MTESTVQVTLNLPHLEKDSSPPPDKKATARIQHILNDIAKQDPETETYFRESGVFGDATEAAVKKFQQKHHISGPDGKVGQKTWTKLLEDWLDLPPHPLG